MQKFTAPVRRGLAEFIRLGLERNVEERIRQKTASHLPRKDRLSAVEIADMRAAVAWIKQEAAREETVAVQLDESQPVGGSVEEGEVVQVPRTELERAGA